MKTWIVRLAAVSLLSLGAAAFAQVATVNILGVDPTSPTSGSAEAWRADGSVGEVTILVEALDAGGQPVAGATVVWRAENRTAGTVWVVAVNGTALDGTKPVFDTQPRTVQGGTTNASGQATITVDSMTPGDVRLHVEIDGVAGDSYTGGPIRVVWF